ncbi:hypothetical protein [Agriterribacter sp.]|uniref:hypothetical protein n=1 Tax=Agriterribacter sp. TaxID=2821509 RepID=UPI002BE86019|nr:hypothetical protein [Agriterribacter sp.]HTN05399.1 hypothetical protein [Agriterribacter sp.]
MKKLMIILFTMSLTTGAFAQKAAHGGMHYVRPRSVIVVGGYSPFYGYGIDPFWGYPYYYYGNRYMQSRPTKLDLQIADIKNDFRQKIDAARNDRSVSKSERRKVVRSLKHSRDQQIIAAQRNYYKLG